MEYYRAGGNGAPSGNGWTAGKVWRKGGGPSGGSIVPLTGSPAILPLVHLREVMAARSNPRLSWPCETSSLDHLILRGLYEGRDRLLILFFEMLLRSARVDSRRYL